MGPKGGSMRKVVTLVALVGVALMLEACPKAADTNNAENAAVTNEVVPADNTAMDVNNVANAAVDNNAAATNNAATNNATDQGSTDH